MIALGLLLAIQTIIDEIAKCEVVCANDHRRRTYNRARSWRVGIRERTIWARLNVCPVNYGMLTANSIQSGLKKTKFKRMQMTMD